MATCNPGGALKWKPQYSEQLRGAKVAVISDHDEPGLKHGEQVADSLAGVAEAVVTINLPGLGPKGDLTDWVNGGGTADQLKTLILAAVEGEASEPTPPGKGPKIGPALTNLCRCSNRKEVDWLWNPYFARKKIGNLWGDPGSGKTYLALQIRDTRFNW